LSEGEKDRVNTFASKLDHELLKFEAVGSAQNLELL
jgi:hypothetical protein